MRGERECKPSQTREVKGKINVNRVTAAYIISTSDTGCNPQLSNPGLFDTFFLGLMARSYPSSNKYATICMYLFSPLFPLNLTDEMRSFSSLEYKNNPLSEKLLWEAALAAKYAPTYGVRYS